MSEPKLPAPSPPGISLHEFLNPTRRRRNPRSHPRRATDPDPLPHAGAKRSHAAATPRDDHPPLPRPEDDGIAQDRSRRNRSILDSIRTDRGCGRRTRRIQPALSEGDDPILDIRALLDDLHRSGAGRSLRQEQPSTKREPRRSASRASRLLKPRRFRLTAQYQHGRTAIVGARTAFVHEIQEPSIVLGYVDLDSPTVEDLPELVLLRI